MTFFFKLVTYYSFIHLQQMRPATPFNRIMSPNFIATRKCFPEFNASKLSALSRDKRGASNHLPPKCVTLLYHTAQGPCEELLFKLFVENTL